MCEYDKASQFFQENPKLNGKNQGNKKQQNKVGSLKELTVH